MTIPIPELSVILFFGICGLIIASALIVVTSPNLVHSAVSLLFTFFGVAAIYIFLYADFIAANSSYYLRWWNFGFDYFWSYVNK